MLRNSGGEYQLLRRVKRKKQQRSLRYLPRRLPFSASPFTVRAHECATQKLHSAPGLISVILSVRKLADVGEKHDREPGVDEQFLVELCRTGSPNVPKRMCSTRADVTRTAILLATRRHCFSCCLTVQQLALLHRYSITTMLYSSSVSTSILSVLLVAAAAVAVVVTVVMSTPHCSAHFLTLQRSSSKPKCCAACSVARALSVLRTP
jgi:hypothetical protein